MYGVPYPTGKDEMPKIYLITVYLSIYTCADCQTLLPQGRFLIYKNNMQIKVKNIGGHSLYNGFDWSS